MEHVTPHTGQRALTAITITTLPHPRLPAATRLTVITAPPAHLPRVTTITVVTPDHHPLVVRVREVAGVGLLGG